ncbi:N-acetylmuramoyl-L-alanine amidase [Dietzia psychralcaliphila]|uniref:N-acetylmuramoyl-L-alanine amidase n=1 Tax=Dietzia psychralcaliphila TaxID=139021 RepID=UPI0020A65C90|nr:N-acetylmuramoyl-L-alanine amidase [Dietzia psychralcaliphila]
MRTRRRPLNISGRRRTLALAVAVAASVVTPLAVYGADHLVESGDDITATAGSAVPTGTTEVALADAPAAAGVDTDIAVGSAPVREVTSETPFSMVGVTWKGHNPEAVAALRAKNPDGSWGPWYEAEAVDGKGESTTGTGGTEPVFLGVDSTTVQIKLSGVDVADTSLADEPEVSDSETTESGATASETPDSDAPESEAPRSAASETPASDTADAPATETPAQSDVASTRSAEPAAARPATGDTPPVPTRYADIKPVAETTDTDATDVTAVLLSPDDTPTPDAESFGDITAQGGSGVNGDIAAKQPSIITRGGWGADESIRCGGTAYDTTLAAATVHHTAGSNNYTREGSAGVVRGIYVYHARNLGWCDVGYNVMVDKYGQAFEGRRGGLNRNVQGAHAGGFNGNTFGISMMGDYSTVAPSDATVRKMGEVIGWRLSLAGVDPKGTDTHYSEGTSYTKFPMGTAVRLPNIFAHRDVGNTSCPGNAGYAKMGQIRDIAAAYAKTGGGSPAPTNPPSNPTPPVTNPGTTPRPGTGGSSSPGLTQGSVQDAVTSALRTVLTGGRLDVAELTRILTGGKTLADIPFDAGSVQDAIGGDMGSVGNLGGGDFTRLASQFAGPLGKVLSGVQRFGNVSLVKHENGALYSSPETGTHPVWGVIGDAWASQGFERGPLGLPVSSETEREDGTVAQRFEGGTLVFDPATKELSVEPAP